MDYRFMKIAEETIAITDLGYYNFNGSKVHLCKRDKLAFTVVEVFSPQELEKIYSKQSSVDSSKKGKCAQITVVEKDSFEAAKGLKNPLVLNFASATHRGGGFLTGSHAQEESLCRCSTLYASLTAQAANEYYEYNRSLHSPLYSDYMLLSPNVCVFRDVRLNLLAEPYNVAVATVPAPNLRSIKIEQDELAYLMLRRIRYFLAMVAAKGYKNIVLGAWGCGAFRHNPYDVAGYFHKVLIDEGVAALFDNVVFAIVKSNENLQAFQHIFSTQNNNVLAGLRRKENDEIMLHLRNVEMIIKTKCSRCDNIMGCLGCNLNELQQDIEHAKKMMAVQEE